MIRGIDENYRRGNLHSSTAAVTKTPLPNATPKKGAARLLEMNVQNVLFPRIPETGQSSARAVPDVA